MASPILYPLINGKRQDGNSIEANFAGQIYKGFDSIDYDFTKTVAEVRGAHPDPLAHTQGSNAYTGSAEFLLAEFNHWLQNILQTLALSSGYAINGSGVGQVPFEVIVNYLSPGMDMITDTLIGCTVNSIASPNKIGSEALKRKVNLKPLKILYNGLDLESYVLRPDPGM